MNIVHIAGHLGADPEVRFTSSGQKVTILRVAARVRRKGKDETIWWRVTIWGDRFDKMMAFFKKGSSIMVVGELSKPEIFTDRDGKPQISMELTALQVLFSPFGRTGGAEGGERSAHSETAFTSKSGAGAETAEVAYGMASDSYSEGKSDLDDEVPF